VQKRSDVITSFLRRGLESRSATARGGVAGFFSRKKPVTKSFHCEAFVQKESNVIAFFLGRGLESRSATARGGVAGFFSRKKPVTKSFHCFFTCVEAFGSESFRLDET
jgi:hypothetical protein